MVVLDNNIICCYFNILNLKENMKKKKFDFSYNDNIIKYKNILDDNYYINKKLLIENLNYLSNYYFIEYESYNDNILYINKNNKIINNKLIEILYNYEEFKKKNNIKMANYKFKDVKNLIYDKNKEELIMHWRNSIENNITILDFINEKKKSY